MENKVTSYELSKQLHELGFDCENYTGTYYLGMWRESDCLHGDTDRPDPIKAYDCHDLLEWLKEFSSTRDNLAHSNEELRLHIGYHLEGDTNLLVYGHLLRLDKEHIEIFSDDAQPQNALALAIIAILGGQNNGN